MYDTEAGLLKAVKDWLDPQTRDGVAYVRICDMFNKGISDIIICVRGQFIVVELKDNTGKPTEHQLKFIERMKKAGAIGGVCRTVKEVADYVEEAKELTKNR